MTERLLSISGEDSLSIDRKNTTAVESKLDTRLMLLSNELPRLSDVSGALAGRMIILRLSESWYGREDPGLFMRLGPELPGILLWAIEGWRRLRARGHFVVPESSQEVQQELNDLTSPVGAFIRQCCDLGAEQSVARDALYVAYQAWCRSEGMVYVSNRGVFGRDLRTAVATLRDVQQHRGPRLYMGIALANHVPFAGLRPRIIWAFSLGQSLAHASSGPQVKPCSGAAVAARGRLGQRRYAAMATREGTWNAVASFCWGGVYGNATLPAVSPETR